MHRRSRINVHLVTRQRPQSDDRWARFGKILDSVAKLFGMFAGIAGLWVSASALQVSNSARHDLEIEKATAAILDLRPSKLDIGADLRHYLHLGLGLAEIRIVCPGSSTSSCPHHLVEGLNSTWWEDGRPAFSDVDIENVDFLDANLDGAIIGGSKFSQVNLSGDLKNCTIEETEFDHLTVMQAEINNCILTTVGFTHSNLAFLSMTDGTFGRTDISGSTICGEMGCMSAPNEFWTNAFYFSDDPPKGLQKLPSGTPPPMICDPSYRTTNERYNCHPK